jgi:cell wall-associated NlpC family hydrolase
MDAETRTSILKEARTWIGTPYHHRGRVKGVGVDCGGLIYELFARHLPLKPFPSDYPADWALHSGPERYLDFIQEYVHEAKAPAICSLVVIQYGRSFSHGGLVTERNTVIHAWGRVAEGKVLESPWTFFRDRGQPRARKFYDVKHG